MRYGVDTGELWVMAATVDGVTSALEHALASLADVVTSDPGSWCADPAAAGATSVAVGALRDHTSAARAGAAGLTDELVAAAQGYADADAVRPR